MSARPPLTAEHAARPRRHRTACAIAALLVVPLAGCGALAGRDVPPPDTVGARATTDPAAPAATGTRPPATPGATPSTPTAPTETVEPPPAPVAVYPLTGRIARSADLARRSAVGVAVSTGRGRPAATGLESADVVWVSFPGAQRQRAVGLFQSADARRVGPVAGLRPLDARLLSVTAAVVESTGGAPAYYKQLKQAGLVSFATSQVPREFVLDAATGAYYGATAAARRAPGARAARPGLFAFESPELQLTAARAPDPVSVAVPGQAPLRLTYDAGAAVWRGALGGLRLAARNVVVQTTPYETTSVARSGGQTERTPKVYGAGSAVLLTGPRVRPGTWDRPGLPKATNFVDRDAAPVRLLPGGTWVLLVPDGTTVSATPTA